MRTPARTFSRYCVSLKARCLDKLFGPFRFFLLPFVFLSQSVALVPPASLGLASFSHLPSMSDWYTLPAVVLYPSTRSPLVLLRRFLPGLSNCRLQLLRTVHISLAFRAC